MSDISNAQNRNLGNLLKIFGSKQATDALKEMSKVKASTWTDIKDTVSDLNTLSTGGGTGAIISSFRDTVELTIEQQLSPLTNEVNQLITDWITANITPILNDIISGLTNLVSDNSTGGLIGSIVGSFVALFVPGGILWTIIGAIIGSAFEAAVTNWGDHFAALNGTLKRRWAIVDKTLADLKEDYSLKIGEIKRIILEGQLGGDSPIIRREPPPSGFIFHDTIF